MTTLRVFASRLWGSLTRRQREEALSEEIQGHLDLLTEQFEADGLSREAARLAAQREFGGIAAMKDSTRDERGFPFLVSLAQDGRYAFRQLRRSPGFTVTAVLTLAVGIGGTTAVYSVFDMVVLRPLSYPNPERLVVIQAVIPRFGTAPVSGSDAEHWRRASTSFEHIALMTPAFVNFTGNGEPERLQVGRTSPSLLRMLGGESILGRLLLDEEDQPGRDRVVVLSHALWQRRFNGDRRVIGRTVTLDGVPHEIVGVLNARFRPPNIEHLFPIPVWEMVQDMWRPLALTSEERTNYGLIAVATLAPGVSLPKAREELANVQANHVRSSGRNADIGAIVLPLQEQMASRARGALQLLLLTVGSVLLIGCLNLANLLLARTLARSKELAIREAIGAGPLRLMRQLLVENMLLAIIGGAAGGAVAVAGVRLIVLASPADIPRLDELTIDGRMLAFAATAVFFSGALISVAAGSQLRGRLLQTSLKERGDAAPSRGVIRLRDALVAGEIGLAATGLIVAALLLSSFVGMLNADKGFDDARVLTVSVNFSGPRYANPMVGAALLNDAIEEIREAPGVMAMGVATKLPLTGVGSLTSFWVEGGTLPPLECPQADVRNVSPGYFSTLSIPLKAGRLLEARDTDRRSAVLSEQLAQRAWPGLNPIGRRFRLGNSAAAPLYEVVGITGNVRGATLEQPLTPTAYLPFPQQGIFATATNAGATLVVKAAGDPSQYATLIRRALRARDTELPIHAFKTMTDVIQESLAPRRFQLQLVTVFAAVAALIAGVGVYGVTAYSVAQRTSEIGVRLALGAHPRTVVLMVLRHGLRLTAGGLALAAVLASAGWRLLQSLLVGVTPSNLPAIAGALTVVALTALAAAALPAIRASHVDPLTALRSE